jgi:hypothetical protein
VDLDERHPHRQQRIAHAETRVRVGAAVENEPLGATGELLNGVDQRALVVGLGKGNPDVEAGCFVANHPFDVGQRAVPVDSRFTLAKQVEIRTVENGDPKGQRLSPLSHSLN